VVLSPKGLPTCPQEVNASRGISRKDDVWAKIRLMEGAAEHTRMCHMSDQGCSASVCPKANHCPRWRRHPRRYRRASAPDMRIPKGSRARASKIRHPPTAGSWGRGSCASSQALPLYSSPTRVPRSGGRRRGISHSRCRHMTERPGTEKRESDVLWRYATAASRRVCHRHEQPRGPRRRLRTIAGREGGYIG
jgi:hypothetical protein